MDAPNPTLRGRRPRRAPFAQAAQSSQGSSPQRGPRRDLARRSLAILLLASVSARVIDRARETNQRIRTEIARDSLQAYIDVFTPMLDSTGQPRPELFVADSLHMTRAGYLLWRTLLAPVVH